MSRCPICSNPKAKITKETTHEKGDTSKHIICYSGNCPTCGKYFINHDVVDLIIQQQQIPNYQVSSILRNLHESDTYIFINSIDQLFEKIKQPDSPLEKIDLLITHIYRKQKKMNVGVAINISDDYSLIFAQDKDEFEYFILQANEMKLIKSYGIIPIQDFHNSHKAVDVISGNEIEILLTLKGWEKAHDLVNQSKISDNAFVAMWFKEEEQHIDKEHEQIFSKGIKPALLSCGYKEPFRSIDDLHNDMIPDRIIAKIKQSSLVVADLTGQRQCVYYEAGFAQGFDIPLIFTCKKDDESKLKEVGFDISPYKIIFWKSFEELKEKLEARIKATIK